LIWQRRYPDQPEQQNAGADMNDEPDVRLGALSLWGRSRQFDASDDYWDGNWIDVRARIDAPGARVETSGPWLRSDEIAAFTKELAALHRDLKGSAELHCMEQVLNVKMVCGVRGEIDVSIELTPDHSQSHRFEFVLDQSYLEATLAGCRQLLERFPVKGSPTA
jgi:hypothetical protein